MKTEERTKYLSQKIRSFRNKFPHGFSSRDIAEHIIEDLSKRSSYDSKAGMIFHELALIGAQSAFTTQYKSMNRAKFNGVSKSTATSLRDAGQSIYISDNQITLEQARTKEHRHLRSAASHTMSAKKFAAYEDFMLAHSTDDMTNALMLANLSFETFADRIAL